MAKKNTRTILIIDDESQKPIEDDIQSALKTELDIQFINIDVTNPDILNEYFGVITDAIFKNKGTLDKFIGDAAMAVFNSPFDLDDYVYRAVMTACDIAKASEALGEKLMERFGKKVSYGIGVNCGQAIIGNIGSNFRMDYTAIGDTVNTASRLESNAKAGEILISEEVWQMYAIRLMSRR